MWLLPSAWTPALTWSSSSFQPRFLWEPSSVQPGSAATPVFHTEGGTGQPHLCFPWA